MPSWTDQVQAWTALISVIVAVGSVWFVVLGIRQAAEALEAQNRSNDIGSVLQIWEKLDEHWKRFKLASNEEERKFEFGQLISYYELSCGLFNDKVFTTRAAKSLYEHLQEILPAMRANSEFKGLFEKLVSRESTFENIRVFCSKHSLGL